MKLRLLALSITLVASPMTMAGGISFTPSQTSMIVSGASAAVILSPVWLPFYGSKQGIEKLEDGSQARQDKKEQAKEQDAKDKMARMEKPADAVVIQVVDKKGKKQDLYIPAAIVDQVNIKNGDYVDLKSDENGVWLYKDEKKLHYFMLPEKAQQFQQQPLNGK